MTADRFITFARVSDLTGLSRSTIYREEEAGRFPTRIGASPGRVLWSEREVLEWMDALRSNRAWGWHTVTDEIQKHPGELYVVTDGQREALATWDTDTWAIQGQHLVVKEFRRLPRRAAA